MKQSRHTSVANPFRSGQVRSSWTKHGTALTSEAGFTTDMLLCSSSSSSV